MSEKTQKKSTASHPEFKGPRSGALRPKDKLLLMLHLPILALLVLPIVPGLWSGDASLFGMPQAIVTMVGLLCCTFVAVLLHFRSDTETGSDGGGE